MTLIIGKAHPGPYETAVLIGLGGLVTMMFIAANYMTCVAGVTVFLIALFSLAGGPIESSAEYRVLGTIVGGAITIAWSLVWVSTTHEHRPRVFRPSQSRV